MSNEALQQAILSILRESRTPNLLAIEPPPEQHDLATALWGLVQHHAHLIAKHRHGLAIMQKVEITAEDFQLLILGLAHASPQWLYEPFEEGIGYGGWTWELERLLRCVLRNSDGTSLAHIDLPEPVFSALRFSLARHGVVTNVPTNAISRVARGFLERGSSCRDQFEGWEKGFPIEDFAKSLWSQVENVEKIDAKCHELDPLVPFANGAQVLSAIRKLAWPDPLIMKWRAAFRTQIDQEHSKKEAEKLLHLAHERPEPLPSLAKQICERPANETDRVTSILRSSELQQLQPSDFLSTVRVTAGRCHGYDAEALCRHFRDQEHLPIIAAFWWCDGGLVSVASLLRALGKDALDPLLLRLDKGSLSEEAKTFLIEWIAKHEPLAYWDRIVGIAKEDLRLTRPVQQGLFAACQAEMEGLDDLIQKELKGPLRSTILQVLTMAPRPTLLSSLEAYQQQKLPAKENKLLKLALNAAKSVSLYTLSENELSCTPWADDADPIEKLWIAAAGQLVAVTTPHAIHLWHNDQHAVVAREQETDFHAETSPDAQWLLLTEEHEKEDEDFAGYAIYRPFESSKCIGTIEPIGGTLSSALVCSEGIAVTLSPEGVLETWDLSSQQRLKAIEVDLGTSLAPLDDARFILTGGDHHLVEVRAATGERIRKLPTRNVSDNEGDNPFMMDIASGDHANQVVALWDDGWIRVWNLGAERLKHWDWDLGSEVRAIEADPCSSWFVVRSPKALHLFCGTLPAGVIPVPHVSSLAFWKPGILAVLHENRVDVWELAKGHLGGVTGIKAMAAQQGTMNLVNEDGKLCSTNL